MSEKEFKEYHKQLQDFAKKVTQSSPDESVKALQDAGILDKNGKLSPQYK